MIDPDDVPEVGHGEKVARYVFSKSYFRSSNNTVKPNAFMPPDDLQMSVTRHLRATDGELWEFGRTVGVQSERTLRGRADIGVADCINQRLKVVKAEIEGNPNHAHIVDWPADEDAQLLVAKELASLAAFRQSP